MRWAVTAKRRMASRGATLTAVVLLGSVADAQAAASPWSIVSSPNPTKQTDALSGVACSAPTACVAVGRVINKRGAEVPLGAVWDGTAWSVKAAPAPKGARASTLAAVACTSNTACTAVGVYINSAGSTVPLAERWNGSGWSLQTASTPAGATAAVLAAVSCVTATACFAVGDASAPAGFGEDWSPFAADAHPASSTANTKARPSGVTGLILMPQVSAGCI